jgi:type III pantothenate kinase
MTRDLPMMAVDVGNSSLAIGRYQLNDLGMPLPEPVWRNQFLHSQLDAAAWIEEISEGLGESSASWLVASVHRPRTAWLKELVARARPADTFQLLGWQDLGIEVALSQPHKVGIDRLAAATAVNRLRTAEQPAIVIDSGSAVTVDLIDPEGCFRGGAIFPGHRMAASSLARQTDLLPEVKIPSSPEVVGASSEQAIASGVYWGTLGAVLEIVRRMRDQYEADAELFLTGGSIAWRDELPGEVNSYPDLVLAGIALAAVQLQAQAGRDDS